MPTATAVRPSAAGHVPLTLVTRGDTVECVHTGSVAVVDVDGRILYAAGDPESLTFTRSALKPLQALPFVAAGGVERFGYAPPQVALLCASHAGEPRHVDAVADMLASAGNTAADLQCGTHAPALLRGARATSRRRRRTRRSRTTARASTAACSRTARPAATRSTTTSRSIIRCSRRSAPRSRMRRTCPRKRSSRASTAARRRTTRCRSANLALAFARLGGRRRRPGLRAGAAHAGRRDDRPPGDGVGRATAATCALMRAGRGDWVTKIGAEGVQAIGVRSRGWGIAVKVADGNVARPAPRDGRRARSARAARCGRARRACAMGSSAARQLSRHRHGRGAARRCLGQNNPAAVQAPCRVALNELKPRETVCYDKRALRPRPLAPARFERGSAGCRTCRSAG